MFATHLRPLSEAEMVLLRQLVGTAQWREVRAYNAAEVEFWEPCSRAFLVKIPAGGHIHRHHDKFITGTTHHLVIETNPGCLNWWADESGEHSVHLEQGHRYRVERSPLHWAENKGATDRIHLLVEFE